MPTSISVTDPQDGATVARTFTARGTYQYDSPMPPISVKLKNSVGVVVAIGSPVTTNNGNWSAPVTAPQPLTGASVTAEIMGTAASDTKTNLTVT